MAKMTGDIYEDVNIVHDAICELHSMVGSLEKECMVRDKDKVATALFIHINDVKREMEKLVSKSEEIMRQADIDKFGPLSKYIRQYLAY